jgi:hypothetical protein
MVRLPFAAFVYGMEMFVKTMQGMQKMTDQSIEAAVGSAPGMTRVEPEDVAAHQRPASVAAQTLVDAQVRADHSATDQLAHKSGGAPAESVSSTAKERREMDKDLHDDMLKLVRYKVLFVKREYEHAFPEREDLVSDNLDGSAFTAWKVAEFVQELGRGETPLPKKWQEKGYPGGEHATGGKLMGLKEEDKKYLRVYYEVLERYPREKFKYEEQQIRVLEEIRDRLPCDDK